MRRLRVTSTLLALAMVIAACSSGGGSGSPAPSYPASIGTLEDSLNLVAWVGYVQDGTNNKDYDWVHPFEDSVGGKCKINVKTAGTSNDMKTLIDSGDYDGVSASGNLSGRLVAANEASPVNVDLVPNYKDVYPAL